MKKPFSYLAFIALPFLFSCGEGGSKTDSKSAKIDTVVSKQCFIAIDEKDTADLHISTLSNDEVTGKLLIKYGAKPKNEGDVTGKFRGDTLFVDYTFKIGTEKTIYKNPLALLKKEGKLILGVGQIETTLGRSYFVKGKPINFERGRFTFAPVECKN